MSDQRGFSDKLPEDHRVDRRIQLLQQRPEHDRQEEGKHALQNRSFGHGTLAKQRMLHIIAPFRLCPPQEVSRYYYIGFSAFCKRAFKKIPRILENAAKIKLDETRRAFYNKGEPHTIEHRGAGKPAEIARCACPFNLIRVMPA